MDPRIRIPLLAGVGALAWWAIASAAGAAAPAGQPPTVSFVSAPAPGDTVPYRQTITWSGTDSDGVVAGYRYAIDPAPPWPFWIDTPADQAVFVLAARELIEPIPASGPCRFVSPHVVQVKSVDDEGLESAAASRSFWASTVAPQVTVTSPLPDPTLHPATVASSFTAQWQGTDPDGFFFDRPVRYRYALFNSPALILMALHDSVGFRQMFAPDFEGWVPTSGDTTWATFTNLIPGADYLFAVVGFDEAGAYSARLSTFTNLVWVRVTLLGADARANTGFSLGEAVPNPARGHCAFQLRVPIDRRASLVLFDLAGRRVRSLTAGWTGPSDQRLDWDLKDQAGRSVSPGVYLARLVPDRGPSLTRRVLVLR